MIKKINQLTNYQIIALGFLIIILIGTLLLMLPISSSKSTSFLDCLFTATSACCVTGLIVADTYMNWTIFGQIIILILIQIGGLGFITIGVFFASFLRRKINLKQRGLIEESMNTLKLSGGVRLVIRIMKLTFMFESIGAIVLSYVFIQDFGLLRGIYYGIFHSISAFCNAGFDLLGIIEPYCSLTGYINNYIVNITIIFLIVIGGLGFIVWDDLLENKLNYHKYLLQTKIVLLMTFLLIMIGTLLLYVTENQSVLSSFFQSVTARTAGFNTYDISKYSQAGKFLMIFLMFIGGSPGSTAGGVKTTTLFVIIVFMKSMISNQECNAFKRRFDSSIIKKASMIIFIYLFLIVTSVFIISFLQPEILFLDLLFEVVSAIGTVGISTGITRDLSILSRLIIILLMYCGRLGSLTFAVCFTAKKNKNKCKNPTEKIAVG